MKYRKGDLGVVLKVKGPAALIRWNDRVEHESPNWRDCVKIVETPYPGKLFEVMRKVEKSRSREGHKQGAVPYLTYKNALIREFGRDLFEEYKEEVRSTIRTSMMHGIRKMTLTGNDVSTVQVSKETEEKKVFMSLKSTSSSLKLRDYSKSRKDLLDVSLSDATSSADNATTPTKTENEEEDKTSLQSFRNFQTPARKRVDTPPQFKTPVTKPHEFTTPLSKFRDSERRNPSPYTTTKPRVPTPSTTYQDSATIPERPVNVFSKLSSSIPCPCCARRFVPRLFFKARHSIDDRKVSLPTRPIGTEKDMTGESQGSCDHLSPHHFRGRLEEFLLEHGYEGLETDRLMCEQDPELFYNMLWYFHIFDLQMIPSDPKHREKMRIITHWASPRVLEKTVSCDDEDDKLIKSIVKCLKVKNVLGAVSLLLTARKKAHESMETEDYDRQMAAAIGT